MMKHGVMMLVGVCAIGGAMATEAQGPAVIVVKGAKTKIVLDPSSLQVARTPACALFRDVLVNDLRWSGWFDLASGSTSFRLLGRIAESSGGLTAECQVYDPNSRTYRFERVYEMPADTARIRSQAHSTANAIILELTGKKGMCKARMALVGKPIGSKVKELFLCDYDGGNLRPLTRGEDLSLAPQWDPQGATIYFTSYKKFCTDIDALNVATGSRRTITEYPGLNSCAAVSPNGRELAVTLSKDGRVGLYVKSLVTGESTPLIKTKNAAATSPAWAPTGDRLVYVSDQAGRPQLYIVSRRGGTPTRLTSRGTENVAPDWGANGWIAHSCKMGPQYQICAINPDSGEYKVLTTDGADYEDPSWLPDGRHLACSRTVNYRSEIWIVDLLGDPPVRVSLLPRDYDWTAPACTGGMK